MVCQWIKAHQSARLLSFFPLLCPLLTRAKDNSAPFKQLPIQAGRSRYDLRLVPTGGCVNGFFYMADSHDGMFDDSRVYTTQAGARIAGVKQARTFEVWLETLECPIKRLGSRGFFTGYEFRLALERYLGEEPEDKKTK